MTFASRRLRNFLLLALLSLLSATAYAVFRASLNETSFFTGWALLISVLVLSVYNARKKLPFLPLGTSAGWLQFHVYLGLFSVLLFLFHVGFRVPNGRLEALLALFYVLVALSGAVGLILSRILPPRLARRGEAILFERIPAFRTRLRQRIEDLVVRSVSESNATTLSDFYAGRLHAFFAGPRHFWPHLVESSRPSHGLLSELDDLQRYLNEKEREVSREMAELIRVKDDLDYQHAAQGILKYWLFLHIPLTYGLLVVSVLHVILVQAFAWGLR